MLTAIVKELAAILKVSVEVILAANKTSSSSEIVRFPWQLLYHHLSPWKLQVDEVKDVLLAHQLSLEIITNLCYEEDGELLSLQSTLSISPLQMVKGNGKIWRRKKLKLEQKEMNKMEPCQ